VLKKPDINKGIVIFNQMLDWLGVEKTDSTKDTAKRMSKMYVEEFCSGMYKRAPVLKTFESGTGMVCVTNIEFTSLCEHHFLPVIGKCGIVYLSDDRVVGLSKLSRITKWVCSRPGLQEHMTEEIAVYIMKYLKPKGVYVAVTAEHLCMTLRGTKSRGSKTNTARVLGEIDKEEAIQLLQTNKFFD